MTTHTVDAHPTTEDAWSDTEAIESCVDLGVLRGWADARDPALSQPHVLPALARLVPEHSGDVHARRPPIAFHGPRILLGRFNLQHGPTDVIPWMFEDHELFELGAPHANFACTPGEGWTIQTLAPGVRTVVDGELLVEQGTIRALPDGARVVLGCAAFRFEVLEHTPDRWAVRAHELVHSEASSALFLKRDGGICGPARPLIPGEPLVIGKTGPTSLLADEPLGWDLSGLLEHERRHIAYRHAVLRDDDGEWYISPLTQRMRVFVNRAAVRDRVTLMSGDEIGLGSVVLLFRESSAGQTPGRDIPPPHLDDWSEGEWLARGDSL